MQSREAIVAVLSGIMEPDLGKDIVSLDLIERCADVHLKENRPLVISVIFFFKRVF